MALPTLEIDGSTVPCAFTSVRGATTLSRVRGARVTACRATSARWPCALPIIRRSGSAPSRPTVSPGCSVRDSSTLPRASCTSTHDGSLARTTATPAGASAAAAPVPARPRARSRSTTGAAPARPAVRRAPAGSAGDAGGAAGGGTTAAAALPTRRGAAGCRARRRRPGSAASAAMRQHPAAAASSTSAGRDQQQPPRPRTRPVPTARLARLARDPARRGTGAFKPRLDLLEQPPCAALRQQVQHRLGIDLQRPADGLRQRAREGGVGQLVVAVGFERLELAPAAP